MIQMIMNILHGRFFIRRELETSQEIHDLKNELARVSAKTITSAKEYKEVMKKIKREDITFKIGVVTGNVRR